MLGRRTITNFTAVVVVAAVLLVYGLTQLVARAVLDPTYQLYAELPAGGGLFEDKQVTYRGNAVGTVREVALDGDAVRVEFGVNNDVRIPVDVDLVILRQSAVGEQALDIRPHGRVDGDTEFYEAGDTLRPRSIVLPTEVQDLLVLADDVFAPIDPEAASQLISELADAFTGRRDDIRSILVDSATFSEAIARNGEDYDRLFAASRVVNARLAEERDTLARLITEMADATTILTDMREEFEGLLIEAPPTLTVAGDLVFRSQANLSCGLSDIAAINTFVARRDNLENAAEALRTNRWFFVAFDIISPPDPEGRFWQRIHMIAEPAPPPLSYLPDRRPIPDILPGGACSSPFGGGAPSAAQANFERIVPEARLVPPEDNRSTPIRRGGGGTPLPPPGTVGAVTAPGTGQTTPLPATGGTALPLLLGALLLAGAARVARRTLAGDPTAESRRHG